MFGSIFIKIQLADENFFCENIYRFPKNDKHLSENFFNVLYNSIYYCNE